MNNLASTSFFTRDLVIIIINFFKIRVLKNIIITSIIITLTIIRYNSFAKRVVFLRNVDVNNSEFKYDLIVDKNNENNNDIFAIIEEKINEIKEDY